MQSRQRNIGLLDQCPIHLRGHVVGEQGALERVVKTSGAGADDIPDHLGRQVGAQSALELLPRPKKRVEDEFAVAAVGSGSTGLVSGVIESNFFAARQRDAGARQFRIGDLLIYVVWLLQQDSVRRQQALGLCAQGMRCIAQSVFQEEIEFFLESFVVGQEIANSVLAYRQNRRRQPGSPFVEQNCQRLSLTAPLLRGGNAQVFVALERGINPQTT